jgi:hypothetical protein
MVRVVDVRLYHLLLCCCSFPFIILLHTGIEYVAMTEEDSIRTAFINELTGLGDGDPSKRSREAQAEIMELRKQRKLERRAKKQRKFERQEEAKRALGN